jgi:hypothetical protein
MLYSPGINEPESGLISRLRLNIFLNKTGCFNVAG